MNGSASPSVEIRPFGRMPDGRPVDRYTLRSPAGLIARIIDYGATLQAIEVPDRDGRIAGVTLGFASLGGYLQPHPYVGCIVGRFANRIAHGTFALDGTTHRLTVNDPPHSLHGGTSGFGTRLWAGTPIRRPGSVGVRLTLTSPDGDEGFPGTLDTVVTYSVGAANELRIDYRATTDRPTIVNLTSHPYWNLAGEGAGTIDGHLLWLNATRYTPIDRTLIPTGAIDPVRDTPLDFFTAPAAIGARLHEPSPQLLAAHGYDHNFVLDRPTPGDTSLLLAARVSEPRSGRVLEILTTEPGIQLYSGNGLDGTFVGAGGRPYGRGAGLALETQHFPDAPNQSGFPSTVLRPGEILRSSTIYRFSTDRPGDR